MLTAARNASFLAASRLTATVSNSFGPLLHNTISFKVSGSTEYCQDRRKITTTPGKLVYMPIGSSFKTNIVESGDYIEIRFDGAPADDTVKIYSGYNVRDMEKAFSRAVYFAADKDDSAFFNCQIQLNIIFSIIAQSSDSYLSGHERRLLSPALDYLKDHLYDPNLSVAYMQELTGLSDTYFRRLFSAYYHVTPQRYIISERVSQARLIMSHNPGIEIQHVAELVGYGDAFYFSRVFKKEVGLSPSGYQKELMRRKSAADE